MLFVWLLIFYKCWYELIDITPELHNALINEYSNEKQPSDGEIY
jgi:hypothetical protein